MAALSLFRGSNMAAVTSSENRGYPSYRPLPKYLKNVLVINLVSILTQQPLSNCQSGFRSLHSTLTALVVLQTAGRLISILKSPSTPLITIFSYASSIHMVLTQSVSSGLSLIFSAKVRDVVLLASCPMLHRFLVAFHRVASLDHSYS